MKQHKALKKYAELVLDWCIEEYGKSKHNGDYPYVEFRKPDHTESDHIGYYDDIDGTIFVNKDKVKSVEELVKTIIHEYCHYKRHKMEDYQVLSKYLSDDKNPMEIEAIRIEERDYSRCIREITEYLDKNKL
jgi:Zn-dependent peptidase ImmA (M78 family)